MRFFVSIMLSDEMKEAITNKMHELKKNGVRGNYTPMQNLHLVIALTDEIKDSDMVRDALQTLKYKPFRLSLTDFGISGDSLWIGIKGNQGLNSLARDVRELLDKAGVGNNKEKFEPHITIIQKCTGNWKAVASPKGEMMVKRVTLIKPEMKDGKRVFKEVDSF